jgi:hypothetical protein
LSVSIWVFALCCLRPQLFCPPPGVVARRLAVPGVAVPSSLLRVAEVGLLDDVGDDDDEAEVLSRDLVVQVVGFRAELEALLVEGCGYGLAWRWVLERTWEGN